jgi:hypothetical protein
MPSRQTEMPQRSSKKPVENDWMALFHCELHLWRLSRLSREQKGVFHEPATR